MIGIDTNILVRYITQDDQKQAALVNDFIEHIVQRNEKLYVNLMVVCELIWVLEECYRYKKNEIIDAIQVLCEVSTVELEDREVLLKALQDFQESSVDFFDGLIGRYNHMKKCDYTISFDKRASKLETFRSLNLLFKK